MLKVKCFNPIAKKGLDLFGDNYELAKEGETYNLAMVRSAKLHEEIFDKNLIAIARAGAGVNNIPLDRCAEEGIVVFNTPGANANAVKELVISGMIMAARNTLKSNAWINENLNTPNLAKEVEANKKKFVGTEILGKKLGVIGLGAIGIEVANAAERLGMSVVGYDPYISMEHAFNVSRYVDYTENIDDIFSQCDYITIHTPLVEAMKGIFNAENIEKMKDGVVILNFARNELVEHSDMQKALARGKIKYYVSDFADENTKDYVNIIATPHLGASSVEAEDNCAIMGVNELKNFVENGNIVNSVNFPACEMGRKGADTRITVLHVNKSNMLSQFTKIIGDFGFNIPNLINKSKGNYAYAMFDVNASNIDESVVKELESVDGVIRVRVL